MGLCAIHQAFKSPGWIFDLMIEFDGTYAKKDKIKGSPDPDSGGNSIFITPSIWMSSNRLIFQWGMGFPILQNLNGKQDKIQYFLAYNLGIAFYSKLWKILTRTLFPEKHGFKCKNRNSAKSKKIVN